MNELKCGQCGSPDIQKASVIYDGGTSTGSSISAGSVGGRGALMSTSTSSQTNLAKKLAPPPRMTIGQMIGHVLAIAFFGGLTLLNLLEGDDNLTFAFGFAIFTGIFVLSMTKGLKNNALFPQKFAEYNRLWHCHKCGAATVI